MGNRHNNCVVEKIKLIWDRIFTFLLEGQEM